MKPTTSNTLMIICIKNIKKKTIKLMELSLLSDAKTMGGSSSKIKQRINYSSYFKCSCKFGLMTLDNLKIQNVFLKGIFRHSRFSKNLVIFQKYDKFG